MLPRRIVDDYRTRTFHNLQHGGRLTLWSAQDLTRLYLDALWVQTDLIQTWLSALAGAPSTDAGVEPTSANVLVGRCSEFVELLDAQLRVSRESMHSILAELQKWAPRPAEATLSAVGVAVDAIQLPAEALAAFVIGAARQHVSSTNGAIARRTRSLTEAQSRDFESAEKAEVPPSLELPPPSAPEMQVPPPSVGTADFVPAGRTRRH